MIGRTARIGNEGLATSFYNHDRNQDLASDLVKVLMECNQTVPDFLEEMKPADGLVAFDDDTDAEGEDEGGEDQQANGGDTWGTGENNDATSITSASASAAKDPIPEPEPSSDFNW
jgi:ATP-dependent RNA helicase DDX3X